MRHLYASLLLILAVTACREPTRPAPPEVTLTGTFTLRTLNGLSLPVTVFQIGYDMTDLAGGAVELAEDDTFVHRLIYRMHSPNYDYTEERKWEGTYTVTADSLYLEREDGDRISMAHRGDTLTYTYHDPRGPLLIQEYRR